MRKAVRQGGYDSLNLYFLSNLRGHKGRLLGECFGPMGGVKSSTPQSYYTSDGCVIRTETMPGGSVPSEYDGGKTAVHEAGHWFGLAHTFEGDNCSGPGDHINDTPAEAFKNYGCPKSRDTCPGMPGMDPVHNFMDYSADACLYSFTKGQQRRMRNVFHRFRSGL